MEHLVESGTLGLEIPRGAVEDDAPLVDQDDLVRDRLHLLHQVSGEQDGRAAPEALQGVADVALISPPTGALAAFCRQESSNRGKKPQQKGSNCRSSSRSLPQNFNYIAVKTRSVGFLPASADKLADIAKKYKGILGVFDGESWTSD